MEKKKYHLKKQIIEAINANDNDLFSLLKSQWAHRFGVESLEELENLDINQFNQNTKDLDDQKIDQSQDNFLGGDKANMRNNIQENENISKDLNSIKVDNDELIKTNSFKITEVNNDKSEALNKSQENKNQNLINVLIPLPPKPKYGFLAKWLLRK